MVEHAETQIPTTPSRVLLLVWSVDTLALRAEIQAPDEVLYTFVLGCRYIYCVLRPCPSTHSCVMSDKDSQEQCS